MSPISGVHAIFWTNDADGLRAFFRDVLGFPFVDAGSGWLVFALPPAEAAVHPSDEGFPADEVGRAQIYLMSDDLRATIRELEAKDIQISRPISDEGWGLACAIRCPTAKTWACINPTTRPRCASCRAETTPRPRLPRNRAPPPAASWTLGASGAAHGRAQGCLSCIPSADALMR